MEIKRFGNIEGKTMLLLHGNLMCWQQFEDLIPLLEGKFCVYAVSFDGFDGTGETTYTTARDQADKLAEYIERTFWYSPMQKPPAQPPCPAGDRMVILPSTAASSISCSRKYSIRIS